MEPIGQTFGDYEIVALIGEGGMGRVYRARHRVLGREVALKMRQPGSTRDHEDSRRFQREARFLAQLSHPNVVKVYDAGMTDQAQLWIAMELLSGKTLTDHLETQKRLTLPRACAWMRDACRGLSAMHDHAIVHRDLKPDNIMVTMDGVVKVMDLGLAKDTQSTILTAPGEVLGTPAYIAPESLIDQPQDHRLDLYQMGVILYLTVTGELPYEADTMHAYLHAIVELPHIPVKTRAPDTPDALVAIIDKALAKEPARRPPSAGAMADALELVLGEVERGVPARSVMRMLTRPRPALVPPAGKRSRAAAVGALALVALATVAGMVAVRPAQPKATASPASAAAQDAGARALGESAGAVAVAIEAQSARWSAAPDAPDAAAKGVEAFAAQVAAWRADAASARVVVDAVLLLVVADEKASFAAGEPQPLYFARTKALATKLAGALAPLAALPGTTGARAALAAARLSAHADAAAALEPAREALAKLARAREREDAEARDAWADALLAGAAVERMAGQLDETYALYSAHRAVLGARPHARALVPQLEVALASYSAGKGSQHLARARELALANAAALARWREKLAQRDADVAVLLEPRR